MSEPKPKVTMKRWGYTPSQLKSMPKELFDEIVRSQDVMEITGSTTLAVKDMVAIARDKGDWVDEIPTDEDSWREDEYHIPTIWEVLDRRLPIRTFVLTNGMSPTVKDGARCYRMTTDDYDQLSEGWGDLEGVCQTGLDFWHMVPHDHRPKVLSSARTCLEADNLLKTKVYVVYPEEFFTKEKSSETV